MICLTSPSFKYSAVIGSLIILQIQLVLTEVFRFYSAQVHLETYYSRGNSAKRPILRIALSRVFDKCRVDDKNYFPFINIMQKSRKSFPSL